MLFGFVFLFQNFRFSVQPTSSVSLISFVEQPGECVDQCRLSAFDHTSIDLQFFRSLSDGQALGVARSKDLGVVGENCFQRLLQKGDILAHGREAFLSGYTDVLPPFFDQLISSEVQPVVVADVFGVLAVTAARTNMSFSQHM